MLLLDLERLGPSRRPAKRSTTVALYPYELGWVRPGSRPQHRDPGVDVLRVVWQRGAGREARPRGWRRGSALAGYQQYLAGVSGEEVDRFVDSAEWHAVGDQP